MTHNHANDWLRLSQCVVSWVQKPDSLVADDLAPPTPEAAFSALLLFSLLTKAGAPAAELISLSGGGGLTASLKTKDTIESWVIEPSGDVFLCNYRKGRLVAHHKVPLQGRDSRAHGGEMISDEQSRLAPFASSGAAGNRLSSTGATTPLLAG